MVESLPPSGIDLDNKTIITNSNDELSVPLDALTDETIITNSNDELSVPLDALTDETIITNSNGELSVPLDGETLAVGSSGKVKVFESTQYYLGNFAQDSGDWTGIDEVSNGIASVYKAEGETASASVTADLTDVDVLNFRIDSPSMPLEILFDGNKEGEIKTNNNGFETLEISGLDNYGANTTVKIEDGQLYDEGTFWIDYIDGKLIQPESRIIELVDTGGLE